MQGEIISKSTRLSYFRASTSHSQFKVSKSAD